MRDGKILQEKWIGLDNRLERERNRTEKMGYPRVSRKRKGVGVMSVRGKKNGC